ncbi:MAG: alpha/beta hydrolase [Thermomicrobiales bacterium]
MNSEWELASHDHRTGTSGAPSLASVWTTLAGQRCHAVVSVRPAPPGAPWIVLVHGFAVSSRYMIPTAERLAGRYPIFAPDLPGYGISDEPKHPLNLPELADVLARWLERRGIERAIMVGHSFGCQIIAELALRRPERVSHAVMIGPTADASARTILQHIWRLAHDLPYEPFALWLIQARDYLRFGPRWQWMTARYMLRDRIEDKLPRLGMPVLVVRGERDPIAPKRWVAQLARLAPSGTLAVVPGAGHAVNYSAPDALVASIERFVNDAEGDRGG